MFNCGRRLDDDVLNTKSTFVHRRTTQLLCRKHIFLNQYLVVFDVPVRGICVFINHIFAMYNYPNSKVRICCVAQRALWMPTRSNGTWIVHAIHDELYEFIRLQDRSTSNTKEIVRDGPWPQITILDVGRCFDLQNLRYII